MSNFASPATCPGSASTPKRLVDYEPLARVCSAFLLDLFAPQSTSNNYDTLPYFIAMALSQSQLPETNALAALTLLQRLRSRHPTRTFSQEIKRNEAERLFLSSYITATKSLSDDCYPLPFWVTVGQSKFQVEELSKIEKEFLEDMDGDVRIDDTTLAIFQVMIEKRKQVWETQRHRQDGWGSRSNSTGSTSSSNSSESSELWGCQSISSDGSSSSPSFLSTPSNSASVDPLIQHGLLRMKESEQNLAVLDQRIQQLQQQLDSLMQKPPSRGGECAEKQHGTRHTIKEKILHVFK